MVVKMAGLGRSFGGVADYCLHDRQVPGEPHPESAERVEWTETRNLATSHGERAATAEAGPELKRLAGGAATGRKLEKPDRQEMSRAAEESLKALGLERHQALIVSHGDGQPHVHVIANRVDPESGRAAELSRSKLRLSKWAERYERSQGEIRCPSRVRNNARRRQGKRVQDRVSRSTGRHRRTEMSPQREQREAIPAGQDGRGGPGTHGSAGALPCGVGASATMGAGLTGKSTFGSGAGDRAQGGISVPQRHGRVEGTGLGGGEDGRALRASR